MGKDLKKKEISYVLLIFISFVIICQQRRDKNKEKEMNVNIKIGCKISSAL